MIVYNYIGRPRLATAIAILLLILLTLTQARPLDEPIDDALQQWNSSDSQAIARRWQPCDWAAIGKMDLSKPINAWMDSHCIEMAKKGHRLLCMMANPNAPQSEYQQYEQLDQYGYYTGVTGNDGVPKLSKLSVAIERTGLDLKAKKWWYISQNHHFDREGYPATGAFFENHASPQQGVIIAYNNKNPKAMQYSELEPDKVIKPPNQIVPLRSWSDVFFLGWKKACELAKGGAEENMAKLEHIFRDNIINPDTVAIIRSIVQKEFLTEADAWPGWVIPAPDVRLKALLGTPNGNGVAWLVGQHQDEIGEKIVDRVHIFSGTGDAGAGSFCLYFHLRSRPAASGSS